MTTPRADHKPLFPPRPRLIERLNAGLDHKLTLISAPAGYGKTTLVTGWLNNVRLDAKMKAIVYDNYGSPDVLRLEEVEMPTPGDGQVLLKVQATSVNWGDWHNLRADPFLVRLAAGLLKPKNRIFGFDVAGQVEAVGRNVAQLQPGDEVFGDIYACDGGALEGRGQNGH